MGTVQVRKVCINCRTYVYPGIYVQQQRVGNSLLQCVTRHRLIKTFVLFETPFFRVTGATGLVHFIACGLSKSSTDIKKT